MVLFLAAEVDEIVMKAQVFAGGRGKGTFDNGFKGGVQLSRDPVAIGEMVSGPTHLSATLLPRPRPQRG